MYRFPCDLRKGHFIIKTNTKESGFFTIENEKVLVILFTVYLAFDFVIYSLLFEIPKILKDT